MSNSNPNRTHSLSGLVSDVEEELTDNREMAVVLAPSPVMEDAPPEDLEEPVLDGGEWREWAAVKEETSGEPMLILPPTFDKETWSVEDPDAPGVTPYKDQPDR